VNEGEQDAADDNNKTGYEKNNNDDYKDVLMMFGNLEKDDTFLTMKRGAKTRWWTIGEAACIIFHTMPMRKFMARNYDDTKVTGKAQKTARTFLNLSSMPSIICDLALIKCYHGFYLADT
jgi:hypothetical protein